MVVSGIGVKIALLCSMRICSLVTLLLILHAVLLKSSDTVSIKLGKGEVHLAAWNGLDTWATGLGITMPSQSWVMG